MFHCDCCNYSTPNKRSFEKHLSTKKHEKNIDKKNKAASDETTFEVKVTPEIKEEKVKEVKEPVNVQEIMSKANQLKMQMEEIKRTSQDVNDIRDKIFNFSEFIMDVMNKTR
jgi:hypothetical protein